MEIIQVAIKLSCFFQSNEVEGLGSHILNDLKLLYEMTTVLSDLKLLLSVQSIFEEPCTDNNPTL